MKKMLPLVIVTMLFVSFQVYFSSIQANDTKPQYNGFNFDVETDIKNYHSQNAPLFSLVDIRDWLYYIDLEPKNNNFLSIVILFQTAYGYIFLGLFTLSGYLIKPRKVWIPLSIGIYIGLALLFTSF